MKLGYMELLFFISESCFCYIIDSLFGFFEVYAKLCYHIRGYL